MSIPDALELDLGILPSEMPPAMIPATEPQPSWGPRRDGALLARRRSESPAVNIHGTFFYLSAVMFWLLSVGGFIMYYIIPKYKVIFEGFDVKLPALTEAVISISNATVNFWYLVVLAIPSGLVGLWIVTGFALDMLGLGPEWGRRAFGLSLRISPRLKTPPLLRCLAVCIEGGRPLDQALGSLSENHPDISFRGRLAQIFDDVTRGDECRAGACLRHDPPRGTDLA